jgi:PEGA domain
VTLSWKNAKALFESALLFAALFQCAGLQARNQVLGQIDFVAANKAARDSGVWIDGQYVGYVKELKGSRKILLLPGKHQIVVRQSGYQDFTQQVTLQPGQEEDVNVAMQKETGLRYSDEPAQVKIAAEPDRAAVFVDGSFVGPVYEFNGMGHGMLLAPGKHRIRISLPGYRPFETEVNLLPHQKLKLKTKLMPGTMASQG